MGWATWAHEKIASLESALAASAAKVKQAEGELMVCEMANDDLTAKLQASQRALERVVNAFERCDSNRGRFSTVGQHDTRCPKGRVDSPDKWRGEWVCACGAEELDEAIEAARKLASPEARATGEQAK